MVDHPLSAARSPSEEGKHPVRRALTTLTKVLVSLGLVAYVCSRIDWREFLNAVFAARPGYLGAFVLLFLADRVLMAFKWGLLLAAAGCRARIRLLFRLYCASLWAGTLLPATIGGDLCRVYWLGRRGCHRGTVLSSVIVERVVAFAASLLLCSFSLFIALTTHLRAAAPVQAGLLAVAAGFAVLAALLGLLRPAAAASVRRRLERYQRFTLVRKLTGVFTEVGAYATRAAAVRTFFALTFLEQLIPTASVFLLTRAFAVPIGPVELLAMVPLITLGMRLPISLDGLGVKEGLFVGLFGLVGVSPAHAFLVSTVDRVLPLLCALPWALKLAAAEPAAEEAPLP